MNRARRTLLALSLALFPFAFDGVFNAIDLLGVLTVTGYLALTVTTTGDTA